MKAEINNENKARFFGGYLGQGKNIYREGFFNREISDLRHIDKHDLLLLKPLSSISDEAAYKCGFGNAKSFLSINPNHYNLLSRHTDYLRSKGYALPWMGLSVEEMIEAGWIKLSTSK